MMPENPVNTTLPRNETLGECVLCNQSKYLQLAQGVLDYEYGTPGKFDYVKCQSCDLVRIAPMPSNALLMQAYPPDYHAYFEPNNRLGRYLKYRYWYSKAEIYRQMAKNDASVLDIGCANGDMLEQLRAVGFSNCVGVEFDRTAAETARERGFEVLEGDVESISLGAQRYDVIVLTNVIEHFMNPVTALAKLAESLTPSGVIVGETPNIKCWDHSLFGRYWGGFHAPRHTFLFDADTLTQVASRAGFSAIDIENMLQPAHWALSVQNLLKAKFPSLSTTYGRSKFYTQLQLATLPFNFVQCLLSQSTSIAFTFKFHASEGENR